MNHFRFAIFRWRKVLCIYRKYGTHLVNRYKSAFCWLFLCNIIFSWYLFGTETESEIDICP